MTEATNHDHTIRISGLAIIKCYVIECIMLVKLPFFYHFLKLKFYSIYHCRNYATVLRRGVERMNHTKRTFFRTTTTWHNYDDFNGRPLLNQMYVSVILSWPCFHLSTTWIGNTCNTETIHTRNICI